MAISDPVAAYNAENNLEAHLLCDMLQAQGIEASAVDDLSQIGTWIGGLLPQVHRPQVWIDRRDIERAKPVLQDYLDRLTERRRAKSDGPPIDVVCEECGKQTSFPSNQQGTVQVCAHCGEYVDVGADANFEDWDSADESEQEDTGQSH